MHLPFIEYAIQLEALKPKPKSIIFFLAYDFGIYNPATSDHYNHLFAGVTLCKLPE